MIGLATYLTITLWGAYIIVSISVLASGEVADWGVLSGVFLSAYFLSIGVLYALQRRFLYVTKHSDFYIETKDIKQLSTYPGRTFMVTGADTGPMVLFCGCNGCNLEDLQEILKVIDMQTVRGVLVTEYPGYGLSTGTPTQSSITEHVAMVANKYIDDNPGVPLYGVGRSLGAAVILSVMDRVGYGYFSGASLIAPFVSMYSFLPIGWGRCTCLIKDPWDNEDVITRIPEDWSGTVRLCFNSSDSTVGDESAKILHMANPNKTKLRRLEGYGHGRFGHGEMITVDPVEPVP